MSDLRDDRTEPIDRLPEPTATARRSTLTTVGNAIAILLVLAIGGAMAAGAVRSLVPQLRGATGASPSSAPSVEPSVFTPRPLPSFTPTPTATRSPSPSPTPTRTATPTPRVTTTPTATPRPPPTTPRPPTPTPVRTPTSAPTATR